MTDQLLLIEGSTTWRLDRSTRERGRAGVAAAREVLRASRARAHAERPSDAADEHDPPSLASAA